MLEKILAAISSLDLNDKEALRAFLTNGLTSGEHALEGKLGIDIPDSVPGKVADIVIAIIDSSKALAEAKAKGEAEAAKVTTPAAADSIVSSTPKGLILAAMLGVLGLSAMPARAADDAPVIDRSAELVPMKKGDAAPFDGRLYGEQLHIDVAKRIVKCETTLKEVEPKVGMPAWAVVLVALGSAAVAASVAVPVTVAVTKK